MICFPCFYFYLNLYSYDHIIVIFLTDIKMRMTVHSLLLYCIVLYYIVLYYITKKKRKKRKKKRRRCKREIALQELNH